MEIQTRLFYYYHFREKITILLLLLYFTVKGDNAASQKWRWCSLC
jgi:hypothetical protein